MPLTQKPRTDPVLGNKEHWEYVGKLEDQLIRILDIFQNQPSQVIQWTPDKRFYSWNYVFTAKGGEMLRQVLEILVEEPPINLKNLGDQNNAKNA